MTTQAVAYVRQSEDDELGITRQRQDVHALAALRGWQIVAVREDNDASAFTGRARPGFEQLLADMASRAVGAVVATELTRITRNGADRVRLLDLCVRHGIVISLTRGAEIDPTTPTGYLLAEQLGSIARFESALKGERQRRAVLQAAADGRRVGGRRPFGYEPDGLTLRPDEAAAVAAGYADRLAGAAPSRIARSWNAAGFRTGQGNPWTGDTVRHVLRNPRYAGLRAHHPAPAPGEKATGRRPVVTTGLPAAAWPGIVEEAVWRAVVDSLTARADWRRRPRPPRTELLLSGTALCGVCRARVWGDRRPSGKAGYRCSAATGHLARQAAPVDEFVAAVVVARLAEPDAAAVLADRDAPDPAGLRARRLDLQTRLDGLARMYADGVLDEIAVRRQAAELRAQLAAVDRQQIDTGRADLLGPLVAAADAQKAWDDLDIVRRRAAVDALMTVILLPPGRGVRTFDPASVQVEWRTM